MDSTWRKTWCSTAVLAFIGILCFGCISNIGPDASAESEAEGADVSTPGPERALFQVEDEESRHWAVRVSSVAEALRINRTRYDILGRELSHLNGASGGGTWVQGWFDGAQARELHRDGYRVRAFQPGYGFRSDGSLRGSYPTKEQPSHDAESCPNQDPKEDTFCGFAESVARCSQTIGAELTTLGNNHPFVEEVGVAVTHESRELTGVRIGNLTDEGDPPSPQAVIIGGQHGSSELITSEMAMRIIRYFIDAYKNNKDGVPALLSDRTLTVVPVLNPDGHDQFFINNTKQRRNGNPCPNVSGEGVDLNRNHSFRWGGPHASPGCGNAGNAGVSPNSEPETKGIRAVIGNDNGSTVAEIDGEYRTAAVANLHSTGNVVGYSPGVDSEFHECGLSQESPEVSNCTPPDQDVLNELFGSQRPSSAYLRDERSFERKPLENGSLGRVYPYGSGGALVHEVQYGDLPGDTKRAMAAIVELTRNPCQSDFLKMSSAQLQRMENDQIELVRHLLEAADDTLNGTLVENKVGAPFAMPHIYRIDPVLEHPLARFGVEKSQGTPSVNTPSGYTGSVQDDRTVDGVRFRTWYWKPSQDPYEFPGEFEVCTEGGCRTARIGGGPVDLCSPGSYNASGWSFVGRSTTSPSNQCYWDLNVASGSATLTTDPRMDLSDMIRARLVFSYVLEGTWEGSSSAQLRVYISNNGFQNCTWKEGTGCRIVETYFHDYREQRRESPPTPFRTETFDVSDFDKKEGVEIRFEATNIGANNDARLYDIHLAGWKYNP